MLTNNYQGKMKNDQKVTFKTTQPVYEQNYPKSPSNRVTFNHPNNINTSNSPFASGQIRSPNNN